MDTSKITPKLNLEYKAARRLMSQGTDFDSLPSKLKKAVLTYQKLKLGKTRSKTFKKAQAKSADSIIKSRDAHEKEGKKLDIKIGVSRILMNKIVTGGLLVDALRMGFKQEVSPYSGGLSEALISYREKVGDDKFFEQIWTASNIVSMGGASAYAEAREDFERRKILKGIWHGLSGTLDCAMAATGFKGAPALLKCAGQGLKGAWASRGMIIPALKKAPRLIKQAPELMLKAKKIITGIKFNPKTFIAGAKSIPYKIYPYFKNGERFVEGLGQLGFAKFGVEEARETGKDIKKGKFLSAGGHALVALTVFPIVGWVSSARRAKIKEIVDPLIRNPLMITGYAPASIALNDARVLMAEQAKNTSLFLWNTINQVRMHKIIEDMAGRKISSGDLARLKEQLEEMGLENLKKMKEHGVRIRVENFFNYGEIGRMRGWEEKAIDFFRDPFCYGLYTDKTVFIKQLPLKIRGTAVHETGHALDEIFAPPGSQELSTSKLKEYFSIAADNTATAKSGKIIKPQTPRFVDLYQGADEFEYFAVGVDYYFNNGKHLWNLDGPLYEFIEKLFLTKVQGFTMTTKKALEIEKIETACRRIWPDRKLKITGSSGGTLKDRFDELVDFELTGPSLTSEEKKTLDLIMKNAGKR